MEEDKEVEEMMINMVKEEVAMIVKVILWEKSELYTMNTNLSAEETKTTETTRTTETIKTTEVQLVMVNVITMQTT